MRKLAGTAAMVAAVLSWAGTAAQAQPGLTLVTSPNVSGSDYDQLDGVAVASAGSAWAVGFARHAQPNCCAPFRALIEHWNGTAWSIKAAAPLPSGDDTRLNAVAVVSPSDVWAVGALAVPGGATHALIEHWNGTTWSTVPAPAAEPAGAVLRGIAAVSASDIWAAGYSNDGSGFSTLIEHWNGTAWSVVPGAPLQFTGFNLLNDVAAVSASDVWAVGRMFRHPTPVIEHWDGTSWTQVTQPVSGYDSSLNSIAAIAGNDIWAVGEQNLNQTVTEHWNGTAWSLVPSPTITAGNAQDTLSGVTALSGHDVWAAGSVLANFSSTSTLALHWNGTTWKIVTSANRGSDALSSVAGSAPGQPLWVAGNSSGATPATATLIETTTG